MGIGEEIDEILAHAPHSRLVSRNSLVSSIEMKEFDSKSYLKC